jgi:hypothetical protein
MPKVKLVAGFPAEEIGGLNGPVKFQRDEGGDLVSEDISDEEAAYFLSIPSFAPAEAAKPGPGAAEAEAKKADLLERAAKVGLAVKGNWGLQRLENEVEHAEKAATGAGGGQG